MVRLALAALLLAIGCGGDLPDPQSPGAVVLREKCGTCHRPYLPGTMTIDMWKVQVGRMHELFVQRGIPWLSSAEEKTLLDYLAAHAGTS
jgi:hypothetical protein